MYDVIMREHPLEDCIESTSVKNLFVAPATLDLSGVDIELVSAFSRETRLKRAIEPILDDFDFVMIDCPPSLGLITINALTAAQEVLVPIQGEYYALEGLSALISTVDQVQASINPELKIEGILRTMFDPRNNLANEVSAQLIQHFGELVFRTVIPRNVRLAEAPSFGRPALYHDKESRGALAYLALAGEMIRRDEEAGAPAEADASVVDADD